MANSKLRFSPLSKTPHISLGWRWERNFCQSCRIGGKRCFLSAEWTIQVGGSKWESQSGDFLDQSAHWNFFATFLPRFATSQRTSGPRPCGRTDFKILGYWGRKITLACRRLKLSSYIESWAKLERLKLEKITLRSRNFTPRTWICWAGSDGVRSPSISPAESLIWVKQNEHKHITTWGHMFSVRSGKRQAPFQRYISVSTASTSTWSE